MKFELAFTTKFKKDFKVMQKRGVNVTLFSEVIDKLQHGKKLSEKNQDHALIGNFKGFRECHITPDWLLIYLIDHDKLILTLTRTGTHSDLY